MASRLEIRDGLLDWSRWIRAESHVLGERPELLFQQAANQPASTRPARAAQRRTEAGLEARPWLRWVNNPRAVPPLLLTVPGWPGIFSPDDRHILTADAGGLLKLWDAATGRELTAFAGHRRAVTSLCFSPDGMRILSGSLDKTVRVWDVAQARALLELPTRGRVDACHFSPNGRWIITTTHGAELCMYDAEQGTSLIAYRPKEETSDRRLEWESDSFHVAWTFAMNTARFVTAYKDLRTWDLILWDPSTGVKVTDLGHDVRAWGISQDRTKLVCAFDDGVVSVSALDSGRILATFRGEWGTIWACALSEDRPRVLAERNHAFELWDVAAGHVIERPDPQPYKTVRAVFDRDGERIGFVDSRGGFLSLWSGRSRRPPVSRPPDVPGTSYLPQADVGVSRDGIGFLRPSRRAHSSNGKLALSGSGYGTTHLWDATAEHDVQRGHTGRITSCVFSPDGRRIVSTSQDDEVLLWDGADGEALRTLQDSKAQIATGRNPPTSCAFSPRGTRFATVDGGVTMWNARTGKKLGGFGLRAPVASCVFSPDGKSLLTSVAEHYASEVDLFLSDVETGREIAELRGDRGSAAALGFSADGRRIVVADRAGNLCMWDSGGSPVVDSNLAEDLQDAALAVGGRRVISLHRVESGVWGWPTLLDVNTVEGLTWVSIANDVSPDGRRILERGDGAVQLQDALTGVALATLGTVRTSGFSPDGRLVFAITDATPGDSDEPAYGLVTHTVGLSLRASEFHLWRADRGQRVCQYPFGSSIEALSWGPLSERIAIATHAGAVQLLRLENPVDRPTARARRSRRAPYRRTV